jgi:retron-type reverse transcriptase
MKKILLLTLLTTFTFSQAEEWIYYQMNASNGNGDLSIYIIKPDGTENELVIDTTANDILERFFPFHPSFI